MPNPRLENYVQVNERIVAGTPDDLAKILSICVEPPAMLSDSMGYIRCRVTLTDGRHADGTASFDLALSGKSAQATNPLEDCETSAVGRALAFLGYHANRSIASREEVREAERRRDARASDGRTARRVTPMPTARRPNTAAVDGRAVPPPSAPDRPQLTPAQERVVPLIAGRPRQEVVDLLGRYGAERISELTDADAAALAADLAGV